MAAIVTPRFFLTSLLSVALVLMPSLTLGFTHSTALVQKDIVLILDNSGSMRKIDKDFITKEVARKFITDALPNSHIAILIFDRNVKYTFRLAPPTGSVQEALTQSLDHLDYRGRFTNIPDALYQAMDELKTNSREAAAKSILLLTDGVIETGDRTADADERKNLLSRLTADATAQKVKIFTVALGTSADKDLLQSLATQTKGDYYWAARGADLVAVFEHVRTNIAEKADAPAAKPAATPSTAATAPATDTKGTAAPATTTAAAASTSPATASPSDAQPASTAPANTEPTRTASEPTAPKAAKPKPNAPKATESNDEGAAARGQATEPPAAQSWIDWFIGLQLMIVGVLAWMIMRMRNQRGQSERRLPSATVASAQVPEAPLAILHDLGGVTGRHQHELTHPITLVGRVPPPIRENIGSITINRATIGRRHAVIERKHFGFWLIDQNSKNGTYVNDQRIVDQVCLTHGDRIRFHEYEFEFSLAGVSLADATVAVSDLLARHGYGPINSDETLDADAGRVLHELSPIDITSPEETVTDTRTKAGR